MTGSRHWLRRLGVTLIAIGVVICAVPFAYLAYGNWEQGQINHQWQQQLRHPAPHPTTAAPAPAVSPTPGTAAVKGQPPLGSGLLFAIRVPKIGYYAAVEQGVSANILYIGPGHYPQTVMPGQPGTVGVAAHNTYWIRFGDLGAGDQIDVQTRTQTFTYTITGTQIVQPSDGAVLDSKPGQHELVMTTCWPLWAGALATQRLIFFATQNGT